MSNDIPTQFRTALNHLLQQEGRGAQVRLARVENIDRGYLNAIIKGRKPGAEAIRSRIAASSVWAQSPIRDVVSHSGTWLNATS
mgnify:CR=1 FL=1